MKFSQFLLEMPSRFTYEDDESVIELNDDEENEYQYEEIKNEKLISKLNGYDLVTHNDGDYTFYDILDRTNKRIMYRCRTVKGYEINNIKFTVSGIVWKSKSLKSDAVDIFYDVILKKSNNAVYSSGSHSSAGERYWDKIVKEAFNKNYKVGIINLYIGTNKQKTLTEVNSFSDYKKLKDDIYGNNKSDTVIGIYNDKK